MTRLLLVLILGLLPPLAAPARAAPWGSLDAQATGRLVAGPPGWLNWCMADPARCRPRPGAVRVAATGKLLDLLARVQTDVNRSMVARAEPPGRDLWQLGKTVGDCEDFALAKQERLRAAGLPPGALRIATARLPHGELHAVLTVETDHGTLVLDNLAAAVVPVSALRYEWLRVQSTDANLRWSELRSLSATAPAAAPLPVGATVPAQ
mgnify:CR=1 FL=1